VGVVWFTVVHGTGLGIENSDDFFKESKEISRLAENALQEPTRNDQINDLSELSLLLDESAMALTVDANGESLYQYGSSCDIDVTLREAVKVLNEEGFVSDGERELYARQVSINGIVYDISIYASFTDLSYGALKVVIAVDVTVIVLGIFMSILITNRFLTKFVFRKIEKPLDILSDGVRQIRDGNLDYQIEYIPKDEFAPVCSDFNEMAERLKRSVELTQKHEQSRKELLVGISHDLRSPLTSIRAYVEGLMDGVAKTPEAQKGYLKIIKNKAEDIDWMVEEIFMFSKMELGEYPEHPKELQLDDEINRFVQSFGSEYLEKGLCICIGELVPARITADSMQLRRVMFNIMENSLKYKSKETGRFDITLRKDNDGFLLILCDDGPGVPVKALPHLFEAFYRVDPARQNPNKGSGLGLSIAANAIYRMRGTIHAEIGANGGLSIVIWLPEMEK